MRRKQLLPTQRRTPSLVLVLTFALACATQPARAANEQPESPAAASTETQPPPRHFAKLTTLDGKTYEQVSVQKVQPDGLLVEFNLPGGGFGTAKLKFRNLPETVRERYSYDPRQAEAFEAAQAEGAKVWAARHEAWAERREAALAEQSAREERLREQTRAAEEKARLAAEQARAEQQVQAPQSYTYPYGWGWGIGWNTHHHYKPHRQPVPPQHVPQPPSQQPLTPTFAPFPGPMRPLGR